MPELESEMRAHPGIAAIHETRVYAYMYADHFIDNFRPYHEQVHLFFKDGKFHVRMITYGQQVTESSFDEFDPAAKFWGEYAEILTQRECKALELPDAKECPNLGYLKRTWGDTLFLNERIALSPEADNA